MKILFADAIDSACLDNLADKGHEVIFKPTLTADALSDHTADAAVVVVRSTKVTSAVFESAPNLSMVIRAGAGVDNIDTEAASTAGVYVCNVPGRNAVAVAELTMALLLASDRHIADGAADLRSGEWDKSRYSKADGLHGKSLALVGLGEIGLAVAERAKAFGIAVRAVRKERPKAVAGRIRSIGIRLVDDIDTLLANADIVSLHVPGNDDTKNMIDGKFLAKLPDGAIILNTSRGDCVDPEALLDALNNRGMKAGLDVWPDEPRTGQTTWRSSLSTHPSVVGSHHIGASTQQAQRSIAMGTVAVIDEFSKGNVINCVNLQAEADGTSWIAVRHADKVGVLAQIFQVLRSNGLNVQQMENQVFSGGGAAVATIHLDGHCTDQLVSDLAAIEEVLGVSLTTHK